MFNIEQIKNSILMGNNIEILSDIPPNSIDLIVTSPPYDELRNYDGTLIWNENIWKQLIEKLFLVMKEGGIIVWIVGDSTVKGSETGTGFKQALYFKEIGFNLHDTMIWEKDTFAFPCKIRYNQIFEYMFIFSKGKPKTVNLITDKENKYYGTTVHGTSRNQNGVCFRKSNHNKSTVQKLGIRNNIWKISTVKNNIYNHPAPFPEKLAKDHILSWSNENDIVLDPFAGSGTACLMAKKLKRNYIGLEINEKYIDIMKKRLSDDN